MARITSGAFLTVRKMDGFVYHLYAGTPGHPSPGPKTVAVCLDGITRFLSWAIDHHGHRLWRTLAERAAGQAEAHAFLGRLLARKPRKGGPSGERLGLDLDQMHALMAALVTFQSRLQRIAKVGFSTPETGLARDRLARPLRRTAAHSDQVRPAAADFGAD